MGGSDRQAKGAEIAQVCPVRECSVEFDHRRFVSLANRPDSDLGSVFGRSCGTILRWVRSDERD